MRASEVFTRYEGGYYYGRWTTSDGRRITRCLKCTDKREAERELRRLIILDRAGKSAELEAAKIRKDVPTIGEIGETFRLAFTGDERTGRNYLLSLLTIIRHVHGKASEDMPATVISGELLQRYQSLLIRSAGGDKIKEASARVTANSTARQAKSLFSRRVMAAYKKLNLPASVHEFKAALPLPEIRRSYRLPEAELIKTTWEKSVDLKESDPAAYMAFLLAAGCGLRKNEIAHARWSWFRQVKDRTVIGIETSADFSPKGKDDRLVPVEQFVLDELKALRIPAIAGAADYVIPGNMTERCEDVFRRLNAWMTGLGWNTEKKIHELRKLYGASVTTNHGLFVTQRLLGHKDPAITSRYYADLAGDLPTVAIFSKN